MELRNLPTNPTTPGLQVAMECLKPPLLAVATESLRLPLSAPGTEVRHPPPPSVLLSLLPSPRLTVTRPRTDLTGRAPRPTRTVTAPRSPLVPTRTSSR